MKLLVPCALLFTFVSAVAAGSPVTAAKVQSRIDAEGASKVLRDLWDHEPQFDQVLSGVESADSHWLQIAVELRKVSDAGASEELEMAVALALPRAPTRVLALVGHGFELTSICTSPFIEPKPGVAEAYERRTLASLAKVKTPAFKLLAVQCSQRVRLTP